MKTTNKKTLNELSISGNKFIVVTRDETHFWKEEIQQKAKKIEGVYLVNLREPTFLCELSASYYGIFLRNYIHNHEAFTEDELTEMEHDNGDQEATYFHGTSVMNIVKRYRNGKEEDLLEYERCNPSYC